MGSKAMSTNGSRANPMVPSDGNLADQLNSNNQHQHQQHLQQPADRHDSLGDTSCSVFNWTQGSEIDQTGSQFTNSAAQTFSAHNASQQRCNSGTLQRRWTNSQTSSWLYHDEQDMSNVVTMVCFATALMENLARINRDAFQEFRLRIGIAIGPVIAGVVGASKPTYDIWGDTVNVASRLESSGVLGRIQVSEQVGQILLRHGQFEIECRGPIEVRGKGLLTTYLVVTPYDNGQWNGIDPDAAESDIMNSGSGELDLNEVDDGYGAEDGGGGGGQLALPLVGMGEDDGSVIELAAGDD